MVVGGTTGAFGFPIHGVNQIAKRFVEAACAVAHGFVGDYFAAIPD